MKTRSSRFAASILTLLAASIATSLVATGDSPRRNVANADDVAGQPATNSTSAEEPKTIIERQYQKIATSLTEKDLAGVIRSGFRTFDAPADEAAKIWKTNFESVAKYGPIHFNIANLKSDANDWIAEVDVEIVFEFVGDSARWIDRRRSRDRWSLVDGDWRITTREDLVPPVNGQVVEESPLPSAQLRQLQQSIRDNDTLAVKKFWERVAGKCPLVEEIPGDSERRLVTFLWRDNGRTRQVEVRGGPYESSHVPFKRLPDSDVWHHSETLPHDSRFVYSLIVTESDAISHSTSIGSTAMPLVVETYPVDPLNPLVFNAGSVLELPAAPKDDWHVARDDVAKGQLERCRIESKSLGESRAIRVYLPAQRVDRSKPLALAIFLDGEDCEQLMSIPTVFDNLIANQRIPPTIGLLVDSQGSRGRDLAFHDPFIEFLADELVTWAANRFHARFEADQTIVGGMSLGGLTATYAVIRRPDVFGNALSQSGSYWRKRPDRSSLPEGWLPGEVVASQTPRGRFYLEVGRFEAPGMVENNRRMRDVLRAKGLDVTYAEYHGGHDHVNWRVSVGAGLIALLGSPSTEQK